MTNIEQAMQNLRFLLLQIRDQDDPIRTQEVDCFQRALGCESAQISAFDLLAGVPTEEDLQRADAVFIGGSGEYSAAVLNPWLERTLDGFRRIYELRKPTFASCWGFQAFAQALGGRCIHDPPYAELGTVELHLTDAGRSDPLFGSLENPFWGQAGHEDHVVQLPTDAVLLASSNLVANQAFRLADTLIYCTQFHPEIDRQALLERVAAYPQYVERIAGIPFQQFADLCHDSPETRQLLRRFVRLVAEQH